MKTPGMFGIAKDLTPEERFNEMERKYSAIIERIQSYDAVLEQFNSIQTKLDSLSHENENLKQNLKAANDLIASVNNSHLSTKQEINKSIQTLSGRLDDHGKDIEFDWKEHLRSEAALTSKIEEKHLDALSALQGYVKNESLKSLSDKTIDGINYLHNEIFRIDGQLQKGTQKHLDLEDKVKQLADSHQSSSRTLDTLQGGLDGHKKDTAFMVASLRKQIENDVSSVKDQVVTYMDNTKIEMIGSPGSMESVQRSISNRMDSIALDGSNAVMKSSNNEQQIKLLEKKLENLSILIKKNEFAKM